MSSRISIARFRASAIYRIQPLFTVERVDESGEIVDPRGLKRGFNELNRRLIERGTTPPWVSDRETCLSYWQSCTDDGNANHPQWYAEKDRGVVDFMEEFWKPEVTHEDRILELGPNAGGNLSRLHELGYGQLAGVDINPVAISELKRRFPSLASSATFTVGPFEDVLPKLETDSVDVIFTMAVLIHLHPSSADLLEHIVRISRKYLCIVELDRASNNYVFPRDYERVFTRLGCKLLRTTQITRETAPSVTPDWDGYILRLFSVPD